MEVGGVPVAWIVLGTVGLVMVALIVYAVIRSSRKDWRALARKLGLSDKGKAMGGLREGMGISIEAREATHKNVYSRLVFRIDFPTRLGLGLTAMGRVAGKRSLRTLTTGDDVFDERVAVESRQEQRALAYLTPERRACLIELIGTDPRASLDDAGLVWNRNETVTKLAELKQIVDRLTTAGQTLYPG